MCVATRISQMQHKCLPRAWAEAGTHGLKEMKMRWSNTIELYPLAMQTSELGVLRSMISVDATFEGWKVTSELNSTPAPIPMMKAPAIKAVVRFLDTQPPPLFSDESAQKNHVTTNDAMWVGLFMCWCMLPDNPKARFLKFF